jgi:hypothetical protein
MHPLLDPPFIAVYGTITLTLFAKFFERCLQKPVKMTLEPVYVEPVDTTCLLPIGTEQFETRLIDAGTMTEFQRSLCNNENCESCNNFRKLQEAQRRREENVENVRSLARAREVKNDYYCDDCEYGEIEVDHMLNAVKIIKTKDCNAHQSRRSAQEEVATWTQERRDKARKSLIDLTYRSQHDRFTP